ncbi:flavin-containing monooxygenase [Metabacillus litoralis]|uniref:Monooxygenase n=1 Tax=Metabacillus litoralis TaxID=152268 RepID=A0A179SRP7_9BACI|nr:NAD(P)/FAD-dependent oxidoreductase [Metabacillus litoralis]OAS84054.1 monooxygenase [Metabacillus litoralis]
MKNPFDSIVIGAGQAGLASAFHLQNHGLRYLVLQGDDQTTGSWSKYYDSLTLFSPARYSSLPGLRFPGNQSRYPSKEEVISYLNEYTKHFNFNIRTGEKVTNVQKVGGLFEIVTAKGNVFYAKTLISATGAFANPNLPRIEGSECFKGKIIHSSEYKNVEEYKNQRVVVVGGGNSAMQIAYELAKVSNVTIASRKPISFIPQRLLGKDIHFWLKVTGIDTQFYGRKFSMNTSVMDTGIYKEAILNNMPDTKNMFTNFTDKGVVWSDGREEKVDAIIYATGYRSNVNYLTSLKNAIDKYNNPLQNKGISTTIDGLYFVGLSGQRSFSSATIRGVGSDAKYVVKKVRSFFNGLK